MPKSNLGNTEPNIESASKLYELVSEEKLNDDDCGFGYSDGKL